MKKRLVAILLVMLLLLGISGTAFAAEDAVVPYASAYLDFYGVNIAAKGNGLIMIGVSVDGVGLQDKIGVLCVDIWKMVDGKWEYHDTMDSLDYPEFFTYKSYDHVADISFYGTPGVTYYATLTVAAFKGSGGDTGTINTPTVLCK